MDSKQNSGVSIYGVNPAKCPELHRILAQLSDEPPPKPEHSLVVIARDGSRMVGTITAERVWCVSNLWLDRELRGTGIAEGMAREIASMNSEGLTELLATTNPFVELLAHRFGFTAIRGTLFRR